ncbi:MAG TPA: 5-deoxy-glucuronate isomerase [Thermoanaerobaculia bacterium]|jgi:5-deoxy-glucuronate isomerase|nr:5-deoxy-glucuronate isomerase [Thermoanaerobaculia bacterium]
MTVELAPIAAQTCVVRDTGAQRGRHFSVTPQTTAARHLHFGRIVLDPSDELTFSTEDRETAFVCLRGSATIREYELTRYDALYVPRDSDITIRAGNEGCDLAEVAAPVDHQYPVQHVRFDEIQQDPALHFRTGSASAERDLNVLIGKNVQAGRIMAGVTFSRPGNWTSWPPHEHARLAEEAYLYIDMPDPGWGIQLVYNDPRNPELVAVVREGDCVLMPQGYHPNVSAPGGTINFLWMMAAVREGDDRQFGVVNVQPEYAQGGSGLEASRK